MWAQLIRSRIKPGKEGEVSGLLKEMEEWRSRGLQPAWHQMMVFSNQKDPSEQITLLVFESEEKARAFENGDDSRRVQARMAELFEMPPQFTDMTVLHEVTL